LLTTAIPAGSHPTPVITKMLSHFAYFKDAGFEFPANVKAMIILCKLPPTMEVVAQILSQTSPSEIKTLKLDGIVKVATLSFEQKGASRGAGGKAPQANKLSAGSRNRRAGKKAHARRERTQNAEFATYIHYKDGPVPTVDPRALAHTTGATNYGPPAFDNTVKAFDLVHRLGVEPSCQTICTLDQVISTASASLDQPKAGPSSLKCPRLKERIAMDVEEDTVSLGDKEEPYVYENFVDDEFNEIDEMASLFRQVPPARTLTHTDTLPLHVRHTLALYIASKYYNMSCCISSQAYICSHEIHDACCANCKGKMADGSEISGAFWLLDSGASHHFTGNLGDFASYQALKHKHYAKTA
ncbi:hypothetical protein SCLCIDRAFT_37680, partial [Scleroderma citrinum Foug A]